MVIDAVVAGLPQERLALHMCRGNWTPDETTCRGGDYRSLPATLGAPDVGVLMLELCTPRAGEIEVLSALPDHLRVGVGAVNQKHSRIENFAEIVARGEQGDCPFWRGASPADPDCGLATFADNPVASVSIAEQKLRAIAHAADLLRSSYKV